MKRAIRDRLLIDFGGDEVSLMADEIRNKYVVERLSDPQAGLVMIKVRETAQRSLFYLGEVLVTECKLKVDGVFGKGILMGEAYERSEELALIDAAYRGGFEETKSWEPYLDAMSSRKDVYDSERKKEREATTVDFRTLAE